MKKLKKKILAIDFDGVLHSYTSGWKGARSIPDPPVYGSLDWLTDFLDRYCDVPDSIAAMLPEGTFQVAIFSSRSRYWGGRAAMKKWMVENGFDRRYFKVITFPLWKPPAFVLIDDRAICFAGTFPSMESIIEFRTWQQPKKR